MLLMHDDVQMWTNVRWDYTIVRVEHSAVKTPKEDTSVSMSVRSDTPLRLTALV